MPQLDINTFASQIFWLFLTFTILYLFVAKVFVPRIGNIVEGRKDSIKDNVGKADQLYIQQKEIAADISATLESSKKESAKLKNDTVKKTEVFYNEEIRKIEKEVSSKMVIEDQKLSRFKAKLDTQVEQLSSVIANEVKSILLSSHTSRKN